jgi:Domain of unknown function (DUF397)
MDGNCVEIGIADGYVLVRDSKDPVGSKLQISRTAWADFLNFIRGG